MIWHHKIDWGSWLCLACAAFINQIQGLCLQCRNWTHFPQMAGEEAEIKKIYKSRNIYLSIYIDIDIYNTSIIV